MDGHYPNNDHPSHPDMIIMMMVFLISIEIMIMIYAHHGNHDHIGVRVSQKKVLPELLDLELIMGACLNPLCNPAIVSRSAVCSTAEC